MEKYIKSRHAVDGRIVKIPTAVQREIIDDLEYMLSLKRNGLNLFFTDIDYIKKVISKEIKRKNK